jgi:DNA repair protein RadC
MIEKPREKASKSGIGTLSDAELLALLLDTGNRNENVLELAGRMLREKGGLRGLMRSDEKNLLTFGVKKAKAYHLLAVREIMKRLPFESDFVVSDPGTLAETLRPFFLGEKTESALVLYLASDKSILRKEEYGFGDSDRVYVPLEKCVRSAISVSSRFVLLVHSHPSGNPTPSASDIALTEAFDREMRRAGILLLDSLILTEKEYCSFRKEQRKPFSSAPGAFSC